MAGVMKMHMSIFGQSKLCVIFYRTELFQAVLRVLDRI